MSNENVGGMGLPFDWNMRTLMPIMREAGIGREARIPVLLSLVLRANLRLRCWPSIDTICKDTGSGREAVTAAIKWLEERKMIYNVPYQYRIGAEKKLHNRKSVYQLTGIAEIDGETYKYLFISDALKDQIADELSELGAEFAADLLRPLSQSSDVEPRNAHSSDTERSDTEISDTEPEDRYSSKGSSISKVEDVASDIGQPAAEEKIKEGFDPLDRMGNPKIKVEKSTDTSNQETSVLGVYVAQLIDALFAERNPNTPQTRLTKSQVSQLTGAVKVHEEGGGVSRHPSPEFYFTNPETSTAFTKYVEEMYASYEGWFNSQNYSAKKRLGILIGQLTRTRMHAVIHTMVRITRHLRNPIT